MLRYWQSRRAGVSESADDGDSKSPGLTPVGVRVPPPAPQMFRCHDGQMLIPRLVRTFTAQMLDEKRGRGTVRPHRSKSDERKLQQRLRNRPIRVTACTRLRASAMHDHYRWLMRTAYGCHAQFGYVTLREIMIGVVDRHQTESSGARFVSLRARQDLKPRGESSRPPSMSWSGLYGKGPTPVDRAARTPGWS